MIATLLIAIPGLLLAAVPMICGMWVLTVATGLIIGVIRHVGFTIKTWFKPHINHVHMTDHEIEARYREMDIKKHGYNPMRHDFHIKELFPKKPEIEKLRAAAKKLFPSRYQELMPKGLKDDYCIARSFLTNMAVERHHQLTAGQWSEAKQKQWLEMPYLPEVMREVDDEFVNWCFLAVGREKAEHYAS
jgi:hypothetical protein